MKQFIAVLALSVALVAGTMPAASAIRVVADAPPHDECPRMKGMQTIWDWGRVYVYKHNGRCKRIGPNFTY